MFGMFKRETPVQKLEKKYKKMLEEAYRISHIDRAGSDKLHAEAESVMKEIENLGKN